MAKAPFLVGQIGHIGLAVRDPRESADWYVANLGKKVQFEFDGGIAVGTDGITLVFRKGRPSPKTIGHVSFHLRDTKTKESAGGFNGSMQHFGTRIVERCTWVNSVARG